MDLDIVLWALGVVIAVLLAIWGGKLIVKRRSQAATADRGSTVIQSGRDTNAK